MRAYLDMFGLFLAILYHDEDTWNWVMTLGLGLEDSDLDRPHRLSEVSRELMICLNKMNDLYPDNA